MEESEFKVAIVKYLSNGTPVVIYEATEPAEVYTVPPFQIEPFETISYNLI